jgi:hypothetical protein
MDAWPQVYPKQRNEPPRVAPHRAGLGRQTDPRLRFGWQSCSDLGAFHDGSDQAASGSIPGSVAATTDCMQSVEK